MGHAALKDAQQPLNTTGQPYSRGDIPHTRQLLYVASRPEGGVVEVTHPDGCGISPAWAARGDESQECSPCQRGCMPTRSCHPVKVSGQETFGVSVTLLSRAWLPNCQTATWPPRCNLAARRVEKNNGRRLTARLIQADDWRWGRGGETLWRKHDSLFLFALAEGTALPRYQAT